MILPFEFITSSKIYFCSFLFTLILNINYLHLNYNFSKKSLKLNTYHTYYLFYARMKKNNKNAKIEVINNMKES